MTLIDGLVLARSAFHMSMNYRSVVLLGRATEVRDQDHKRSAFKALVEHILPGRSADIRAPSEQEIAATSVLCLPITEASAKARTGGPVEAEADYALPCWAGVVPLALQARAPVPDSRLPPATPLPRGVAFYTR